MDESSPVSLTPGQVRALERLLQAGFRFVTFERYASYIAAEKNGFIALLDPAGGKLRLFSQVGYQVEDGIAMLVERGAGKVFVWKGESVEATPELLVAYERVRRELGELLVQENV